MDLHRLANQFPQIAAGVPGPVAVFFDKVGIDTDGQFLLVTMCARSFPWWSTGTSSGVLRFLSAFRLSLLFFVCFR